MPDGGRRTKKRYRITPSGLDDLRGWVETPIRERPQRDPAYLKAAYLEWASPEAARTVLEAHAAFHRERRRLLQATRATLLDRTHATLVQRLRRYPAEQHDRIVAWKIYAYDGLIAQAETEVAWAERGLELVEQLGDLPPLSTSDDHGGEA